MEAASVQGSFRVEGCGLCILPQFWRIKWKRTWKMVWKLGLCGGLQGVESPQCFVKLTALCRDHMRDLFPHLLLDGKNIPTWTSHIGKVRTHNL